VIDDLVEVAIEQALEQKAAVEIVRSDGARHLMGERRPGSVAALVGLGTEKKCLGLTIVKAGAELPPYSQLNDLS
jgi:hypothetical protein